jgi:hypothetical protein
MLTETLLRRLLVPVRFYGITGISSIKIAALGYLKRVTGRIFKITTVSYFEGAS